MTSQDTLHVLVDEMLLDAGEAADAQLRTALLSIGSLSSLPAPEPTGDLARLITAAAAPADELARRRRRRPFNHPTALGLALLAGMGTGIGGVAASSAAPVQAGSSLSVQDMLEDWTPSWTIRAQLPEPGFPDPAAVSSVVGVPSTPAPVVDPEPAGSHTPEPAGGQLAVAEESMPGVPAAASGNPPSQAPNAAAGNPDSSRKGAARVPNGAGAKGPAPAPISAGQPQGADPAVPAEADTVTSAAAGESDGTVGRLVKPLAEVLRPAGAAPGSPAGTPVDAWLQKFQR
ncbi:hypothetical protein ACLH0K_03230 [Arthrobacter sp. MPF02]|uniref:hypothetical protein n=1 Tax=Arthrobacter sp. MPF02 TaxID=3388492 RepID=UPI003984BF5D